LIISLNWLKDYINLDGISVEEIEDKLSTSGLEVEEITDYSKLLDNFVVGYVKEKVKHPNADKLSLCKVFDGEEDLSIVCGAPNVDAGQNIVLAKVGAVVPNGGFEIKSAKIRGEKSFGMICSESELGISENHDGIMVLDSKLVPGTPAAKALGLDDVVFEISVTPNRPDALSHIGVARDLSAVFNIPFKYPTLDLNEGKPTTSEQVKISIEDTTGCSRYIGKVVKDVTIKESPDWMKKRLTAIGLRPRNNIVDISNYVLHEVGQPLHTFDLDTLSGSEIIVKKAGKKKKFVTLDSKERELLPDDLMICDAEKEVAIAGVMGGENSEVTANTKNILIEAAYFHPSYIRKTAKRLGLSSDASYRFERGCDPEITLWAAERAAALIAELGDGKISEGEVDVYPNKYIPKVVNLRFARINKILGYEVAPASVKEILGNLGFKVVSEYDDSINAAIPSFRPDCEREIDLIEEVARINGFDKIPVQPKISVTLGVKIDESAYADNLRTLLTGLGLNEIVTNSLLNKETAEKFGRPIGVLNPQSVEMSHMRPTLVPGMLSTFAKNLKVKEKNLALFEIGSVFNRLTEGEIENFSDFTEVKELCVAFTGNKTENEWSSTDKEYDFYHLKGVLDSLFNKISVDNQLVDDYNLSGESFYNYGVTKKAGDKIICRAGKVNAEITNYFDIQQDVYVAVINISELKQIAQEEKTYTELLKYPKVFRDFAVIVEKNVDSGEIVEDILTSSSSLLKNIKLFDIFEGESVGKNKKSLAFRLEYFDKSATLTEDKVEKEFWKAIDKVKNKFNAQLRG